MLKVTPLHYRWLQIWFNLIRIVTFSPVGHWKKVLVSSFLSQPQLGWPVCNPSFFHFFLFYPFLSFFLSNSMTSSGGFPLPPFFFWTLVTVSHKWYEKHQRLTGLLSLNSLTLRWFRKTWVTKVPLQLPWPTEGGSVVKAYFRSLPAEPHCRHSLLVLHLFTLLRQYYLLQHQRLIVFICSNHVNISCHVVCFSGAFRWSPQTWAFDVFDKWLLWLCK